MTTTTHHRPPACTSGNHPQPGATTMTTRPPAPTTMAIGAAYRHAANAARLVGATDAQAEAAGRANAAAVQAGGADDPAAAVASLWRWPTAADPAFVVARLVGVPSSFVVVSDQAGARFAVLAAWGDHPPAPDAPVLYASDDAAACVAFAWSLASDEAEAEGARPARRLRLAPAVR